MLASLPAATPLTMVEDNLCDSCNKPLTIRRNKKGSRYVACMNAGCARSKADASPAPNLAPAKKDTPNGSTQQPSKPARKPFSIGW